MSLQSLIKNEDRQFGICCPPGIDEPTFTSIVGQYSKLEDRKIYIVASSVYEFDDDVHHIDYEKFMSDGIIFSNNDDVFIFQDGIEAIKMLPEVHLTKASKYHKMIFVIHYGITVSQVKHMSNIFPEMMMLYGSFAQIPNMIKFNAPILSTLSEDQIEEIKISDDALSVEDMYFGKDLVEGITSDELLEKAKKNTDKLKSLLVNITLNRELRHVVYTKYSDFYGLETLKLALNEVGSHVYVGNDMIDFFNENVNQKGIIILDSVPMKPLHNVNHCNFYDSPSYDAYTYFIKNIYKVKSYPTGVQPNLFINFYVAISEDPNYDSVDDRNYEKLYADIGESVAQWDKFVKYAQPVVVGDYGELVVQI